MMNVQELVINLKVISTVGVNQKLNTKNIILNVEPLSIIPEFAQLMGMSNNLSRSLAAQGFKTYKYLPYGNLKESIPYLLRRLHENYPMIMNIFK